ncbi:neurofibromin-like [Watersipora subatra]|uniref:neurofibromin-like n=1 Tax=Watersipora subatra TaxID=2589382 RepID=UPI00355C6E24
MLRQENDAHVVNTLLPQVLQLLNAPWDASVQLCKEVKGQAERVLYALSHSHFNAIFSRVSRRIQTIQNGNEDNPDTSDINLLQHLDIDLSRLIAVMTVITQQRNMKKVLYLSLAINLEKVIWTWMEKHHDEFAGLVFKPNDALADLCDRLFEMFSSFADGSQRKKSAVWPLLIMLLVITPKFLEEITSSDTGAPCSTQHLKKKQFVDELRKAVNPQNNKLALIEGAVTACVRMCKAFTFVKSTENSSVLLTLVKSVVLDLKAVLFNPNKPFKTSTPKEDIELMIDCFVSFYRTTPHCNDVLQVVLSICLNPSAPTQYHFMLVRGLLIIIKQKKITWWPKIGVVYSKGEELRKMFSDTMQSVMLMIPNRVPPPQLQH